MKNFFHFIQYNNAFPIILGIIFLGGGTVFAATNPEIIYEKEEHIISIDNTYIVEKDLNGFTPTVQIIEVTEDDKNYFVSYLFTTIDLKDAVWQDVEKENIMAISKVDLGQYRDLGFYVMGQLRQKIEREIAYLQEVQGFEKESVTQKTVATKYGGLVGAIMDDKTEVLPGYIPVVEVVDLEDKWQRPADDGNKEQKTNNNQSSLTSGPSIQILGNNPAWITLKSSYIDLGAIAHDSNGYDLTIKLLLNGSETKHIQIDTSTTSEYIITYRSTDGGGNTSEAIRHIVVYDPTVQTPPPANSVIPTIPDKIEENEYQDQDENEEVQNEVGNENEETQEPELTCNENNLNLCNQTECEDLSYHWYDNQCNVDEEVVEDTTAPLITLLGDEIVEIILNEEYTDAGATANDETDGDITPNIITNNPVDTSTTTSYTITYNVQDEAGNQAEEITRTVNVVE